MSVTISEVVQHFNADAWIATLPMYHQDSIIELKQAGQTYDEIADTWLKAAAMTTAPFSSGAPQPANASFLKKLKNEVAAFLCGAPKYNNERKKLLEQGKHLPTMIISTISVAISQYVNVAVGVLTPIVALILATLSAISMNAWCATMGYEQKETGESDNKTA